MAANIHICYCETMAEYNKKRKAINDRNVGYIQNGATINTGTPEILWESVVYIKETNELLFNFGLYASNGTTTAPESIVGESIISNQVRLYEL